MIHSGSRGLGHQVATDALRGMERAMARDDIAVNDRQLACARISSQVRGARGLPAPEEGAALPRLTRLPACAAGVAALAGAPSPSSPPPRARACTHALHTQEGQDYLGAMACAANYAFVNRSTMTFLARQAFAKVFDRTPEELDMHVVYDVSHNIAKARGEQEGGGGGGKGGSGGGGSSSSSRAGPHSRARSLRVEPLPPPPAPACQPWQEEEHVVDGQARRLLVHRKGSTRAFPPNHPDIPADYQVIGQPVLIGGTMGTCSYVLTGERCAPPPPPALAPVWLVVRSLAAWTAARACSLRIPACPLPPPTPHPTLPLYPPGTERGMTETFGSTCHGAGRAKSRNSARTKLEPQQVLESLKAKGIAIRRARAGGGRELGTGAA